MNKDIEERALKLVEQVMLQIKEQRDSLAKEMSEQNLDPTEWYIEDNFKEIIDNPSIPYYCKATQKPRMNRAS